MVRNTNSVWTGISKHKEQSTDNANIGGESEQLIELMTEASFVGRSLSSSQRKNNNFINNVAIIVNKKVKIDNPMKIKTRH